MKRNYMIAGVVTVSLLVGAGAAMAQGKQRGMGGMGGMGDMGMMMFEFSDVDKNGDGKISQAEMEAHAKVRFDAADTDGNGKLSAAEMTVAAEKMRQERRVRKMAKMIERMDADKDGELSFEEMPGQKTRADRMFMRLDKDGDGAISQEEMEAARKNSGERRGEGRHGKHRAN